jgi:hypothetical protein
VPATEDNTLRNSIYVTFPEKAKLETKHMRLGQGLTTGVTRGLLEWENVLELDFGDGCRTIYIY